MTLTRIVTAMSAAAAVSLVFSVVQPAQALTMQECSAKYKEAQAAKTLNGMKWNDFRKAQCGTDAAAGTPAVTPAAAPAAAPAKAPAKAATAPAASGTAVFPSAVSSKYSSESAGKARMHTCRDQYQANKASNGNGGLKWIQKGGGYYSECNAKLKS